MIITTTPTIEGRPVQEYLGIITGEVFVTGGFLQNIDHAMGQARKAALTQLESRARQIGANAVLAVTLDFEVQDARYYVLATGTAVVIP